MKNRFSSICLIALTLALLPAVAFGARNGFDAFDDINKVMVTVEYKAEMTFMGSSEDIQGRVMGLSIGRDGLVIFDGTMLNYNNDYLADFGAPRVDKPKSLKVTDCEGRTYDAEFIGVDEYSAIAFCRLPEDARDNVKAARFEDTNLELGDKVCVFWMLPEYFEPRFQISESRITCILEEPEKYYLTGELNNDFVLSPVLDSRGRLVGVITVVHQGSGSYSPYDHALAFGQPVGIMPLDDLKKLLDNPPTPGMKKKGWMGIALQALDPDIGEFWDLDLPGGIIVTEVIGHSPAEKAGLKQGDFIIEFGGHPVNVAKEANLPVFQKMIADKGAGAEIDLKVLRPQDQGVDTLLLHAQLAKVPLSAAEAEQYEDKNFDLTVRDLVFSDYNMFDVDPDKLQGVIVEKMERGGWASIDGLQAGDIIMKLDDKLITSVEEFQTLMEKIAEEKHDEVVFMAWRRHQTLFVRVKTHWE